MTADATGIDVTWDEDDTDQQINTALAIRACLDNLRREASEFGLGDLVCFLDLASMAASQAAEELGGDMESGALRYSDALGRC